MRTWKLYSYKNYYKITRMERKRRKDKKFTKEIIEFYENRSKDKVITKQYGK